MEIHRILSVNGILVLYEPCDDNTVVRLLRKFAYKLSPLCDEDTERGFTSRELRASLRRAGFLDISIQRYGLVAYLLFANPDALTFTKIMKWLPGIHLITKLLIAIDEGVARRRAVRKLGLTIIAVARK